MADCLKAGAQRHQDAILRAMATSSRRYLVPLTAAITVLAALAAIIGWQLGQREKGNDPITLNNNSPSSSPSTTPPAVPCLPVTQDAAHKAGAPAGIVAQVLYIRTSRAEVWICKDLAGKLYYQGHQGNLNDRDFAAASDFSIFLTKVEQQGDGSYVATNEGNSGKTTYTVSPTRLLVISKGRTVLDETVTSTTAPS